MSSRLGGSPRPAAPGSPAAAGAAPGAAAEHAAAPGSVHELAEVVHDVEEEDRPPAAGPLSTLLTAVAVVALGVAALVGSLALGVGSPHKPAAGTWPLIISVVLICLGVALAAVARRTHDAEQFSRTSWLVLAGLATLVVFVALISVIGFEIPALLLAFVWLKFLGHEGWRTSVVTSVAVVAAFYLLFVAALAVPIPHLF